jgi:Fe-S cluster assembly protein SufD
MTPTTATQPGTTTFMGGLEAGIRSIEGEPESVVALRLEGSRAFAASGVPTPKREEWRFTSLRTLTETAHEFAAPATADISPWVFADSHLIVIVNGRFSAELSSIGGLPEGVTVSPLAAALGGGSDRAAFALGKGVDLEAHPFAALNTASFVDGVFIHLGRGAVVEKPIHMLFVTKGGDTPVWCAPRTLISADSTAEATIVEHYVSSGGETLTLPVTELQLAAGAVITHARLQEESRAARHIALQTARLGRDSRLESVALNVGAALARIDITAELGAPGAHASLDGLYLVEDSQHTDTQLKVRHAAPHCTSHELYKGILDGKARAVFLGRIMVDEGAQKTDAIQSNRNLLLSRGALVNSNPQLEILADDVRCTHGSTVGRLDEEAIFYLRSRGIDRATAESLLTYAFAAEVVQEIPVTAVRERMERHLVERLPQGELAREAF